MPSLDHQLLAYALAALSAAAVAGGLLLRSRRLPLDGELFDVSTPLSPRISEQLLMSLHGMLDRPLHRLLHGQPHLSLEFSSRSGKARLRIWIPTGQRAFLESLLRAAYPGVELVPVEEREEARGQTAMVTVTLADESFLPLRVEHDSDPLASLFWTLARTGQGESIDLQILVRPKPSGWQTFALLRAQALRDGQRGLLRELVFGLRPNTPAAHYELDRARAIEEKATRLGFDCAIRVVTTAGTEGAAHEYLRAVAASLRPLAGENSFQFHDVIFRRSFLDSFRRRSFPLLGAFTLTTAELATLWHPPASEPPPQLEVIRSRKLAPPSGVHEGARLLGVSTYGEEKVPVRLSIADSRRHCSILGPTGTGKSTLMANLALQDIRAGRGVGIVDPKGDVITAVLERIPEARMQDVVLISPDTGDFSVGINPLEMSAPTDDRGLVAENTLTIFKRIYQRFWGPRTDDVLKSTLLTLLRQPQPNLAQVPLLLTDGAFRSRVLSDLADPIGLESFWRWFDRLTEAQRGEAIGPVMNKLRDFLVRPRLRRILCQSRSTVDLRSLVDSGGILLADLSIGRWGETAASLVGSFLVAKLWQAVLARSAVPEERRRDFFLYVDEFQNFQGISGPFADTLAQARSLRLCLTVANQHLAQLPRELREALISNARSRVIFQCGQDDAEYLAREFAPLDAASLMALPRYEMAVRLSIGGATSAPFTARTMPIPPPEDGDRAREVAALSAERYGRHVAVIDRELQALLAPMDEPRVPGLGVGRRPRR